MRNLFILSVLFSAQSLFAAVSDDLSEADRQVIAAAIEGSAPVLLQAMQDGGNPRLLDNNQSSAFAYAIRAGSVECCEVILNNEAASHMSGVDIMDIALTLDEGPLDCFEFLLQNFAGDLNSYESVDHVLVSAALANSQEAWDSLVERGANPSVLKNDAAVTQLLTEIGALDFLQQINDAPDLPVDEPAPAQGGVNAIINHIFPAVDMPPI